MEKSWPLASTLIYSCFVSLPLLALARCGNLFRERWALHHHRTCEL
jgi:hypothetical protein